MGRVHSDNRGVMVDEDGESTGITQERDAAPGPDVKVAGNAGF